MRKYFSRLCKQFQLETAVDLSCVLRACMERDDLGVYVGFSFSVRRPYYGVVHNREPHRRSQEHWRADHQHGSGMATERELKYSYMAKTGNAARWYSIPYISCGQVVSVQKLKALESGIIQQFPNSLNQMRHPMAFFTSVADGSPEGTSCA